MKDVLKFPPFAKGVALGMVLMGVGFYALLYATGASVAVGHHEPTTAAVRCFPASAWNGDDAKRPCIEIATIAEDGSARVVQRPANNSTETACVLHNPAEESRYLAECRRVWAGEVPLAVPLPWPLSPGELRGVLHRTAWLYERRERIANAKP